MLFKIAWRNVWRNKLRSAVVMTSIALGMWAGLFVLSMSMGLNDQRTSNAIESTISHIQIHHPQFQANNDIGFNLEKNKIAASLSQDRKVKAHTLRKVVNGMLSSSTGAYGVKMIGIDPEDEKQVTNIHEKLQSGSYLQGIKRNPILIGRKLADKLKVDVRSKIVLTFQDKESEIIAASFKVAGIYKTASSIYDESNVFVRNEDIENLTGGSLGYHEAAIMLHSFEEAKPYAKALQAKWPAMQVQPWTEVAPELGYADELMATSLYIFIGIIMLALAFGIINTMLMAVLERKKELGMLMAVGMNKLKVFSMVVLETVFLAMIGGPLGILGGYLTITYFGKAGIDLSVVGKGLESLGVDSTIYTSLDNAFYFNVGIMVIIMAVLASVYPAIKALKLRPAEAVRAI